MTAESKQHQLQEQLKWKQVFASLIDTKTQREEWKKAFEDVISKYSFSIRVQPKADVWAAAFKSVIESWDINPADSLAIVLQQIPQHYSVQQVQRVESLVLNPLSEKVDKAVIQELLDNKGIRYFYHFTDERNLDSIKKYGGLYSWYSCDKKGIHISHPGGSPNSRILDSLYDLQDYVRLSFCDDHPMAYRHIQDGANLVLLKISTKVACLQGTLFSDINATANGHTIGGSIEDLKRVDFRAVKKHYVSRNDPDFSTHQAECMVKQFIPLEYILNIDNPERM